MIGNNGLTASDCPKNAEIAPPNSEVALVGELSAQEVYYPI